MDVAWDTGVEGEEARMSPVTTKIEVEANVAAVAVEHVSSYRALQARIAGLEAEAKEHRQATETVLETAAFVPGACWEFPGIGVVRVVKGRVTEKLDRARLARAGVAAELLDAATVRVEGPPSVRIEGWREGGADEEGER